MKVFSVFVIVTMATATVKGDVDVADYFPDVGEDLSIVTWGHAINSQEDLKKYIADPSIMMLEADVSAGHLTDQGPDDPLIPIMAHPPHQVSDLSLEMWIDQVIEANKVGKKKGAKLDFKDLSIVQQSLELLKSYTGQINFPLWLNADILKGPVLSGSIEPIDADKFLAWCSESFPQATLSVGWTTKFTSSDDDKGTYTKKMVEEMSDTLEKNTITQPITFPIRAAFIGRSLESLEWLVDAAEDGGESGGDAGYIHAYPHICIDSRTHISVEDTFQGLAMDAETTDSSKPYTYSLSSLSNILVHQRLGLTMGYLTSMHI
ncbi:protein FAM151B isoform X2 [Cherax quadricarinatus]|uniref:protein FAM151B isoform X2 n=1 Tax=Cherax quadricarinatus TaxID=27406 RepID=UPI00387E8A00